MAIKAPNVDKVVTPGTTNAGFIFRFPLGTVVSSDPNVALPAGGFAAGLLEGEIAIAANREDGTEKKALGNTTIKTIPGTYSPGLSFTVLESLNPDALGFVKHEDDYTWTELTSELEENDTGKLPDPYVLVLQYVSSSSTHTRQVFDRAETVSIGDQVINDEDFLVYEVTIKNRKVDGNYSRKKTAPLTTPLEPDEV